MWKSICSSVASTWWCSSTINKRPPISNAAKTMKPEPVPTPALEPLAALQQQLERRVVATRDLHAASSASFNLADSAPNLATQQRELPSTAAATAPARAESLLSSKKPGYLRRCGYFRGWFLQSGNALRGRQRGGCRGASVGGDSQ